VHAFAAGEVRVGEEKWWIFGDFMGVVLKREIPKWLVYFMENPAKMDDLGIITPISGNLLMGV
jgi:hypothetical protein